MHPIWSSDSDVKPVGQKGPSLNREALSDQDRRLISEMKEALRPLFGTTPITPEHLAELAKMARLEDEEERQFGISSLVFLGNSKNKGLMICREAERALLRSVDINTLIKAFCSHLAHLSDDELFELDQLEELPTPFKSKVHALVLQKQMDRVDFSTEEVKAFWLEQVAEEFYKISERDMAAKALLMMGDTPVQQKEWVNFFEFLISRDKETEFLQMDLPKTKIEAVVLWGIEKLFVSGKHERSCLLIKSLSPKPAETNLPLLQKIIQTFIDRLQINLAAEYAAAWPLERGQYAMIVSELVRKDQWNALILFLFDKRYLSLQARLDLIRDLERYLFLGKPLPAPKSGEKGYFQNILYALVTYHGKTREWADETLQHYYT